MYLLFSFFFCVLSFFSDPPSQELPIEEKLQVTCDIKLKIKRNRLQEEEEEAEKIFWRERQTDSSGDLVLAAFLGNI